MTEPRLPITGGCLCGGVRYTIGEAPLFSGHCHCRNCRKHTGAAFATDATFRAAAVTWSGGQQRFYGSSASCERGFCPVCGSTISARYASKPDIVVIAAGSLDNIDLLAPSDHAFVKDKAGWLPLGDGLPQFQGPLPDFKAESEA